ncbi:hypothetical protein [Tsukamurella paurometabola]|uniref:Uncharacterized protein n=1 Tax=Tsukamurella paurometabola TaxID=2061 RepID=A0ABS5NEY7_TSUPA|nr:hypothetical protein [Tsukamurella paurometabola]MBS4102854.1 hypothetical protein [Tsukamurella paurometabola]
MSEYTDPDFGPINALDGVDVAGLATGIGTLADGMPGLTAEVVANATGLTIEKAQGLLVEARQHLERAAADAHHVAEGIRILREGRDAWLRDAPKAAEIEAALAALGLAKAELQLAATTVQPGPYVGGSPTAAASAKVEAAAKKVKELKDKRKKADEALAQSREKAEAEFSKVRAVEVASGTPAPGTGGGNGKPSGEPPSTSPPRPSGETGHRTDPSKKTAGTGTGATPSSTKPSATEGSTATPESAAALAALLGQQQQPQAQQAAQPTAQATPTASAPVASTPQQGKEKDTSQAKTNPLDKILGSDGILDTGDLPGLGVALSSGSAPTPATSSTATPAASITPTAPAPATPSTTGLSASATANQQPATSGTSATGLQTGTDVSGRAGEPRSAFSPAGPETKTSGATGTNAAGAPAHAAGTRPMGGAGMPMMPPVAGMGGPGGGAGKDRDKEQVTLAAGSEESYYMHGRQSVDEAVPWGTIARNDGKRSGPQPDAA